MPALGGILESSLYVEDLQRSVSYYQRIFGFELIESHSDRLRAMKAAPQQVLLLFKKGASPDHDGAGRLHLAFAIPRAAEADWEAWLAQQGVTIVERKTWQRGGSSLYFRDPDQHLLELVTPGCWANY